MALEIGIKPPSSGTSSQLLGSRFTVQVFGFHKFTLRTKRTVDKDVYKVTRLFALPKWNFLLHTEYTTGS